MSGNQHDNQACHRKIPVWRLLIVQTGISSGSEENFGRLFLIIRMLYRKLYAYMSLSDSNLVTLGIVNNCSYNP